MRGETDPGLKFNSNFGCQPRDIERVSPEWAAPNTVMPGFDLEEAGLLKCGRGCHLCCSMKSASIGRSIRARTGLFPLEVRFRHDTGAFVQRDSMVRKDDQWTWWDNPFCPGIDARMLWVQIGVCRDDAVRMAVETALKVAMDRCPKIGILRHSGNPD